MNLYWPVYKKLESELNAIMFEVHVDDDQLNVYSPRIGDIIVRAVTEIESISKSLYSTFGGTPKTNLKYDYDCLKFLATKLKIDKKIVHISSLYCFQSARTIKPFAKVTVPQKPPTYIWNNAYQNIKHDRINTLKLATIGNLFSAMSALYLLNVYVKFVPEHIGKFYDLEEQTSSQGSDIFTLEIHIDYAVLSQHLNFRETNEFDSSVLWLSATEDSTIRAGYKLINKQKTLEGELYYEAFKDESKIVDQYKVQAYVEAQVKKIQIDINELDYYVVLKVS